MSPITIEVIAPIPEGWGICANCEAVLGQVEIFSDPASRNLDAYPADWVEDYSKLSAVIKRLSEQYGEQILIEVTDNQSLQGILKSVHHRIKHYPAFVIRGWGKVEGLLIDEVEALLYQAGCEKKERNENG